MNDLLVNLLASVIAGAVGWLAQFVLTYRRMAKKRSFFGIPKGQSCLLVVSRHASSPSEHSVHQLDTSALVELATVVKDCGGHTSLITVGGAITELGRSTEFCVGGPTTNPRMAIHLRALMPGIRFEFQESADGKAMMAWWVGETPYHRERGRVDYAMLAKICGPSLPHPVFLIGGQTAYSNHAAAAFLASRYRKLTATYGVSGRFCVILRVAEPRTYGTDLVEIAAEVTTEAFAPENTVTP